MKEHYHALKPGNSKIIFMGQRNPAFFRLNYVKTPKMKLKILLFATLFSLSACDKEDNGLVTATIEGFDFRKCACCGGLIVKPADQGGDVFQWYQKNGNLGVTADDNFPLSVKIKYHHLAESCTASAGEIEITELHKQ